MLPVGDSESRRTVSGERHHDGGRTWRTHRSSGARPDVGRRRVSVFAALALLVGSVLAVVEVTSSPVHALTSTLSLGNVHVVDTGDGTPIEHFKFIINEDNTGTTEQRTPDDGCSPADVGYPETCSWTSMGIDSHSPIFTQGDETDLAGGLADVPDGRYLISVLADGYKLDGQHFTMPLDDSDAVVVELEAPPLPDTTIQAAVFEDISPVNGAPDLPAEHGLAGFSGLVKDTLGDLSTDVYGNPLCGTGVCLSYCYVVDNGVDVGIVEPDDGHRCPNDPTDLLMYPLGPTEVPPIGLLTGDYTDAVPTTSGDRGQDQGPGPRHQPLHAVGHPA